MDDFLQKMAHLRSDFRDVQQQIDAKVDNILEMLASMQQQLQMQEMTKREETGDDFNFAKPQFHNLPYLTLPRPQKIGGESEILPPNQQLSPMSNDSNVGQLESEWFGEVLSHPPIITTVAKEADLFIEETTHMKAHKVFDEMLEPEMKVVCMSEMLGMKLDSGAEENEDNDESIKEVYDSSFVTCYEESVKDPNSYVSVFWKMSNIDDESKIMVDYVEHVVAHVMWKCVGVASKSLVKNKSNETTWSFDPGGCRVFDHSSEVLFVGLGERRFSSLFWSQPMETIFLLSTTNPPTSALWNTFNNVKFSYISLLMELGIVIGSKNVRVLHAAASVNIVDWLEIMCSGFLYIDCTRILNYIFLSNSIISQHQMANSLNNKTIHHRIFAEWAEEPPDCTYFLDLHASEFFPSGKIKLSFQSHLSVFYMSFEVTGRPFGVRGSIPAVRSFVIFRGFMVNSFIWSIQDALVTTELGTMFLKDGGYVVRQLLVGIEKCSNEVIDRTLHPTLFSHYPKVAFRLQQFLVTFKQCIVLVRLAEDVYFVLVNDFQTPLQRTLFFLEFLGVVSYNPPVTCELPTVPDPENEKSDEKSSNFQQNDKRHKHQNLVQDISIQVLEELSFVQGSTCETTSQLFKDSHYDSFSLNGWWKDDSVFWTIPLKEYIIDEHRDFMKSLFEGMQENLKYAGNFNMMNVGFMKLRYTRLARRLFEVMLDWNLCSWNMMVGEYCQNKQFHEVIVLFEQLFVWKMFELNSVTVVAVVLAIEDFGILVSGSWMNKFVKKQKNFDKYSKILLLIVVGVEIAVCDQLLSKLPPEFRHLSREDTTRSRGEYCCGNGAGGKGGVGGGKFDYGA